MTGTDEAAPRARPFSLWQALRTAHRRRKQECLPAVAFAQKMRRNWSRCDIFPNLFAATPRSGVPVATFFHLAHHRLTNPHRGNEAGHFAPWRPDGCVRTARAPLSTQSTAGEER
ncbi:hypothetical protein [Burkholderia anthina]|uniref:hypothetical protein n=1 Tax=Burkholderia anthina TaxID=179879 RepID=UPI001FC97B65|nr:hypothetical protein [Burkholderia anthina]